MLAILVQVHKKMAIRLKILNQFDENFLIILHYWLCPRKYEIFLSREFFLSFVHIGRKMFEVHRAAIRVVGHFLLAKNLKD